MNFNFILGGTIFQSTQLVTLDPPSAIDGPVILPEAFDEHCSVLVDDTVYLIGGYEPRDKVLAISIHDGSMNYLTPLNIGRYKHACGYFTNDQGEKVIVVSGGNDGSGFMSTEMMVIGTNLWEEGKLGRFEVLFDYFRIHLILQDLIYQIFALVLL